MCWVPHIHLGATLWFFRYYIGFSGGYYTVKMDAGKGAGEFSNKKIETLRRRRVSWAKGLEENPESAGYQIQVMRMDYEIEDAVKLEAKRQTRLALKHISKKLAEIDALRERVGVVLFDGGPLMWTERMSFRDELDKVFDMRKVLYGEN